MGNCASPQALTLDKELEVERTSLGPCPICRTLMTENDRLMILVRCAHIFHMECLLAQGECRRCQFCHAGICPEGGLDVLDPTDAKWLQTFDDNDRKKIIHTRSRCSK